jgi:hypothetical protein
MSEVDEIILVCSTQGYFLDDLTGVCADCATGIVYQPHAPTQGVVRVCMPCAERRVRASGEPPTMIATEQTKRELAAWVAFQQLDVEMRRGGKLS